MRLHKRINLPVVRRQMSLDPSVLDEITISNDCATWARQSSNATSPAFTVYLFVLGFYERLDRKHGVLLLTLPAAMFSCALIECMDRGGPIQAYVASGILWVFLLGLSLMRVVATEISMLRVHNKGLSR